MADLQRLVVALGVHAGGGDTDVHDILARLESDVVVDVFATEVVANGLVAPAELGRFVHDLDAAADRPRASLRLLAARLAEWSGQAVMGERFVDSGLALAPDSVPLLLDAAWSAADRGDADRAVAFLGRAGAPDDDPDVLALRPFTARGRAEAGDATETSAVDERARRLHAKAMAFARRPPQHRALLAAATAVGGVEADPSAIDQLAEVALRPLVANLVLFEGGIMIDFAAERRPLLPPEEQRLARRWAACRHTLLVADDEGRLRDLATARTSLAPPGVTPGDVVVGVLVPVGGGRWAVLDGYEAVPDGALRGAGPFDAVSIGAAVRASA